MNHSLYIVIPPMDTIVLDSINICRISENILLRVTQVCLNPHFMFFKKTTREIRRIHTEALPEVFLFL